EASEAEVKATLEAYYTSAVVEIVDPHHLDDDTWAKVVEPARRRTITAAWSAHTRMLEVTKAKRDIADLIAATYTISTAGPLGAAGSASVQTSCGGCSYCRWHHRPPYANRPSSPEGVRYPALNVSEQLQQLIDPA